MHTRNLRSIAYLTVVGSDPVEEIEAASSAGLDAVGLRVIAPLGLGLAFPIVGQPDRIRAIKHALEQTGIRVLDTEVVTLTDETRVADLLPLLEVSAELGARYVQITSEDHDRSRGIANFAQVCEAANQFDLRLAFEFMQWRTVKTIEQTAAFVREAGQPNGGIVLDTLHLSRSGGSPASLAHVPPEAIFFVQLCDASATPPATDAGLIAEARGGRLYPGESTLWLDDLFDVLPDDIAISVEVPPAQASDRDTTAEALRGAQALDRWLAAYRDATNNANGRRH